MKENEEEIKFVLNDVGRGGFVIEDGNERLAEMEIAIKDGHLTVFHTGVTDKLRGKGIGGKLLSAMVMYAREHHLDVIPLCSYVREQFKIHPDQYADIWNTKWHH